MASSGIDDSSFFSPKIRDVQTFVEVFEDDFSHPRRFPLGGFSYRRIIDFATISSFGRKFNIKAKFLLISNTERSPGGNCLSDNSLLRGPNVISLKLAAFRIFLPLSVSFLLIPYG